MHHIQKKILVTLASESPVRFTKLKPSTVPNNTFSYHLKYLLDTAYIENSPLGYRATRKGLKSIEYSDSTKAILPLKVLTMSLILDDNKNVLLRQRTSSPVRGWYGIPSGMIHESESTEQAAEREIKEKTGLTITGLTFKGLLDFRYTNRLTKDTYVHAIAFIYTKQLKELPAGLLPSSSIGEFKWSDLKQDDILPEVKVAFDMLADKKPGIVSIEFDEPVMPQ
jgi:ADP-ribose pyrophosphatase YjhB (NUDIX family)